MKVTRLDIGYEYDFDLFGVSSSLKDYKLAWLLNNSLRIDLQRSQDHVIDLSNGNKVIVPLYHFEAENNIVKLLRNKSLSDAPTMEYMVPELKHFDYFVMKEGLYMSEDGEFVAALRRVTGVEYAITIDIDTLKSKENFIF